MPPRVRRMRSLTRVRSRSLVPKKKIKKSDMGHINPLPMSVIKKTNLIESLAMLKILRVRLKQDRKAKILLKKNPKKFLIDLGISRSLIENMIQNDLRNSISYGACFCTGCCCTGRCYTGT